MPQLRTILTRAAVTLGGAGAVGTLAACAPTTAQPADVSVVAAFYPLQYVAEEVGGEHAAVGSLTAGNGDAHGLELSPNLVARMDAADLIVYLSGFQSAVDDAVAQAEPAAALDVADAAELLDADGEHADAREGHEHDHDDTGAHLGHDHHGAGDPHFWLDPLRLADVAEEVADALTLLDPPNADDYAASAGQLAAELAELDAELRSGLAQCASRTVVTTHDAYGYLAHAYDLDVVSISGLDPEAEPSPARMVEVADVARDTGATTIFLASPEDRVARALATDLGLGTAVLDPLEAQLDPGRDYPDVMRANLAALQEALSCR